MPVEPHLQMNMSPLEYAKNVLVNHPVIPHGLCTSPFVLPGSVIGGGTCDGKVYARCGECNGVLIPSGDQWILHRGY